MKKTTMLLSALALCGATLFAQPPGSIQWNGTIFPAQGSDENPPASLRKIFSNLGTGTDVYTNSGWTLAGPLSAGGFTQYVGLPFTSKVNAHVEQVRVAVQYAGTGANQINLSLYSDASGAPGTLLAGPVTVKNMPAFYTCCKLADAAFSPSLAITAGVQYWIVADTPATGTGSDFSGVWAFVPPSKELVGINQGSGWFSFPASIQESAGEVLGTVP